MKRFMRTAEALKISGLARNDTNENEVSLILLLINNFLH
jgi:hypothetical protein